MSEEQIMLKLEMYLFSFYQNNCIEHTCQSAINVYIYFPQSFQRSFLYLFFDPKFDPGTSG